MTKLSDGPPINLKSGLNRERLYIVASKIKRQLSKYFSPYNISFSLDKQISGQIDLTIILPDQGFDVNQIYNMIERRLKDNDIYDNIYYMVSYFKLNKRRVKNDRTK